ncbi:MAG: BlaI/MecI/CopY family transcriptional regulator [Firmicutes bacterium]|jgi:predicted transcriptional regulator|nr:BlaI/MecI/CopY family transcriptional regulator [Bacillota bacterium]
MKKPSLGNQELDLLTFIAEKQQPISVRQITDEFGVDRGLARTTIFTMLDRLYKKSYLSKVEIEGLLHYSSQVNKEELLKNMIGDFVRQRLKGSLSPLVAYLAEEVSLNEAELEELKQLVRELDRGRGPKSD